MDFDLKYCIHIDEDTWWEYDAKGIALCRVCVKCKETKLAAYRKDVLSDPNYEADEDIDP